MARLGEKMLKTIVFPGSSVVFEAESAFKSPGHLSAQHASDLGGPHEQRQRVRRAPERLRRLCGRRPPAAEAPLAPFRGVFGA